MKSTCDRQFYHQRTLAKSVSCSGIGVHSGRKVRLNIHPAPINHGIKFKRTDLSNGLSIPALFNRVVDTSLATVIGQDGCIVSTIEHLMATFSGLSIDNALVELDSYELPIMDGSAAPFTQLIKSAGIKHQNAPRFFFMAKEPIILEENGKSVGIYPDSERRITYTIVFNHPLVQTQSFSINLSGDEFENEIAQARTFGFYHEIEYLKKFGLARGGSLDNAVVLDQEKILNPGGLRYPDEFVRHKILDCIGDFSLLGMPIMGHIKVHKSGHEFNHEFLKEIPNAKRILGNLFIAVNAGC
jgi:UDP-3-O-[3-hydroxymyristoyl] N-acetylglucosamine deacetylase